MYILDDADSHRTFCSYTLNLKLHFCAFNRFIFFLIIRCIKEAQVFGVFFKEENRNFTIHWIQIISKVDEKEEVKCIIFEDQHFVGTTEDINIRHLKVCSKCCNYLHFSLNIFLSVCMCVNTFILFVIKFIVNRFSRMMCFRPVFFR